MALSGFKVAKWLEMPFHGSLVKVAGVADLHDSYNPTALTGDFAPLQ